MPKVSTGAISAMVEGERAYHVWRWVRWMQVLLIPITIYLFAHYAEHKEIDKFMGAGQRFVGTDELPNANALRSRVLLDIHSVMEGHTREGHGRTVERLASIEAQLKEIKEELRLLREQRR